MRFLSATSNSRKYGRKESGLSLFQIDAGREWRGGQRQALLLARELERKGYDSIFCVQPKSPLHQKAASSGVRVFPLKIRSELDLLAVFRLSLAMKAKKCVLVHSHDAHAAAIGLMAASFARVPVRVISRRVDFPLKKNFLSRLKYGERTDRIIAISKGVKKVLVKSGVNSRTIDVIPSGIDFTPYEEAAASNFLREELSLSPEDFLVGIVAHLSDHKGHKYLIDAARLLKEKDPRIKVIIVGEGPLRMELTKQVSSSHLENVVFFLGFREDIPKVLNSLDLFVLSSRQEGMGSSLLDAMACKLPIVATKVGGIPEVVTHGKTGLLVAPKNARALARAILSLYSDRDLASQLGQKGYEAVHEKFSAQAMADKIIHVYEGLARKKRIRLRE
jgi:glycosyltransferase involved in cell wall biosynthesis